MRLEDEASTTDVTSQGPSLQCEEERERQGAVAAAETGVFEGPGGATLAKKPLACKPRGRMLSHHRASGLVAASESAHVQFLVLASTSSTHGRPKFAAQQGGGIIEKPSGVPQWRMGSLLLMALHGRLVTAWVSKGKGSKCYALSPSIHSFHFYKVTSSFSHRLTDTPPSTFSFIIHSSLTFYHHH
jgi:hypothetical protein